MEHECHVTACRNLGKFVASIHIMLRNQSDRLVSQYFCGTLKYFVARQKLSSFLKYVIQPLQEFKGFGGSFNKTSDSGLKSLKSF